MTKEKALKILDTIPTIGEQVDALDMAIKALEQEPKYCDRNICIKNEYNGISCDECEVTKSQEPKTGYWIYSHNNLFGMNIFKCSKCDWDGDAADYNYCPNCGCRMVETQEKDNCNTCIHYKPDNPYCECCFDLDKYEKEAKK